MKCPMDGATLQMTERSGVEIDYCPQCRGVWLDRGELDKIIDRAQPAVTLPEPPAPPSPPGMIPQSPRVPHGDDRRAYGDKLDEWRDRDETLGRKGRRKGFLGELFDF